MNLLYSSSGFVLFTEAHLEQSQDNVVFRCSSDLGAFSDRRDRVHEKFQLINAEVLTTMKHVSRLHPT